jgi:hypothetical protein
MLQQGALLTSDEFRVERRANGEASSVMARLSSLARRWPVVGAAELPTSAWGWAIRIWDGSNLAPRLISRARFLPSPIPAESPSARSSRPVGLAPAAPGAAWTPARAAGPGSRAATGGPAGTPRALDAARERRGTGRVAVTTAGPRPGAGARPRCRHRRRGRSMIHSKDPAMVSAPAGRIEKAQAVPECPVAAAENSAGGPGPFGVLGRRWPGMGRGRMADPIPLVDLASLTAGGSHPGARGGWAATGLSTVLARRDDAVAC